jgi:DNA-binding XRE family transcriptional regulator
MNLKDKHTAYCFQKAQDLTIKRKEKGISQLEMAVNVGVSHRTIYAFERFERPMPYLVWAYEEWLKK